MLAPGTFLNPRVLINTDTDFQVDFTFCITDDNNLKCSIFSEIIFIFNLLECMPLKIIARVFISSYYIVYIILFITKVRPISIFIHTSISLERQRDLNELKISVGTKWINKSLLTSFKKSR